MQLTGKKSLLTGWSKQMGKLSSDDKKTYGGWLHEVRSRIQQALTEQQQQLEVAALNAKLAAESIDITLPARGGQKGHLHPVTMITQRMQQYFVQAGFNVATGPEVESDYYNFEALNIPSHHPARAMHDTFYFDVHFSISKKPSNQIALKSVRHFGKINANHRFRNTASQSARCPYQMQNRYIYRYQYRSWSALVDAPYRSPSPQAICHYHLKYLPQQTAQ